MGSKVGQCRAQRVTFSEPPTERERSKATLQAKRVPSLEPSAHWPNLRSLMSTAGWLTMGFAATAAGGFAFRRYRSEVREAWQVALPQPPNATSPIDQMLARVAIKAADPAAADSVIMLSANYGYLDFVANWACLMRPLNLRYMVLSMDRRLHAHLNMYTEIPSVEGQTLAIGAAGDFSEHLTPGFTAITYEKLKSAAAVLERGYNLVFTDADIAWLKDPFGYFRYDVDFEFQAEPLARATPPEVQSNIGFFFAKPTAAAVALLVDSIALGVEKNYSLTAQMALNQVTRRMLADDRATLVPHYRVAPATEALTYRHLSPFAFPNGHVLFNKEYEDWRLAAGDPTVIAHFTSVRGAALKRAKMHEFGMWRVVQQNLSCVGQTTCFGEVDGHWLRCAGDNETVVPPEV